MTFPENWPEGCPPGDAVAAHGDVFRVVKTDPPQPGDFRSLWEQGRPIAQKECESAGLSVFQAVRDAAHAALKYPYLGELVARGTLGTKHGVVKPTPRSGNSHTTWWPCDGLARHELFIVVRS